MRFSNFKKALSKAWAQDTAYHKDAPRWTPDNPAIGQCAITALLFNEYFGGKIFSGISDSGIVHYWNKKFGFKIDLTAQQFDHKIVFHNITEWEREKLLLTGDVLQRYNILKERVASYYR